MTAQAGTGKFKIGDEVFAFTGARLGCHAEYKCMPEDGAVALKPANLTFDEAAAISSCGTTDRKSTRLNSSHPSISYAVFCLKKKKKAHTKNGAETTKNELN